MSEDPHAAVDELPQLNVLGTVRRRLLRGSSWVLVGRIVTIVLGVVINALLARLLTPDEFGAYFTCFTMVVLGSLIAQLGLDRAVVRLISAALGTGQPGKARHAIERIFAIGSMGSLAMGAAMAVLGPWLARNVYHSELVASVSLLTAGWLVATSLQSLFVEAFRGLQRFDLATMLDAVLLDVLWASCFGALFLLGTHVTLGATIAISAGTTMLLVLISGWVLLRRTLAMRGAGRVARGEILAIAWPSLITNVASYLLSTGVDLLVLAAFRPESEVALYGAATRLVVLVATPLWILRGVLPPLIAELHAQGRRRTLERTLRAGATLAGLPSLLILVVFVLFGRSVLGNVYGPFYTQGALVLTLLSLGRLVSVWAGASGVTLIMTGHQKAMMYLTVSTGALSVAGGILLAPRFGGPGVAAATLTMAIVQNVLQVVIAKRAVGVWTFMEVSPRALREFFFRKGSGGSRSAQARGSDPGNDVS
jgi:O-antigen/teichoic acid export membrane protein